MLQMASKASFNVGEKVVYPSHGVGEITAEETQVIAGVEMKLYVITFDQDKMILRVPTSRAIKTGLRHLCSSDEFKTVMNNLKGRAKAVKGMWSKRAQEYENKINSGDVIAIAEVLKDLHKNIEDPDRSYSERLIYDAALDRLSQEYSAAARIEKDEACNLIIDALNQAI